MKILLYIIAFLFCFRFMGIIDVPSTTVAVIFLLLGLVNYQRNLCFNKYIIAIAVCLVFNFFSCLYFNGQDLLSSFRGSNQLYSLALFWFFYSWHLNLKQWENVLWWICLCFGICYIIQYLVFPTIIFGGEIRTESIEQRITIFGQGLASFSVIFGINKYLISKNIKYIVIIFTGFFAVFGCGYRTMLLALIISILVLLFRMKISFKTLIPFVFVILFLFLFINSVDFVQEQLVNMANRQEKLEGGGFENDIRYINLIYRYTSYFESPIEMILGSGMPFDGTKYFYENYDLEFVTGFYSSDWGLIGLSWMIGIPAVIIMIVYSIQIFKTKVPKEYLYIGVYFFNILISSITTHEFYIFQNFVVQAILFCVFAKILKCFNLNLGVKKVYNICKT